MNFRCLRCFMGDNWGLLRGMMESRGCCRGNNKVGIDAVEGIL